MNNNSAHLGDIVAFGTTLSWSLGIFPFTEAARRLGPNAVNHFRLVLAVLFLTIISIIFLPTSLVELFTSPQTEHWIYFGLSGVVGLALGDYFGFTSFAILGARVGSIFSTLATAAALITAYFVIGERINLIGIIGILITIGGVIWLTMSRRSQSEMKDHEHGNVKLGVVFGVLSAVCQGVGVVLANKGFTYKQAEGDLAFFHATWLRMISATVIIYIITISRGKLKEITQPVLDNKNNGIIYTLGGTIFGPVIGVSLSMYAVSLLQDKPSIAQTIFSLVPVFVLPLSYLFYKEKITARAILGATIAIIGVMILIWREQLVQLF